MFCAKVLLYALLLNVILTPPVMAVMLPDCTPVPPVKLKSCARMIAEPAAEFEVAAEPPCRPRECLIPAVRPRLRPRRQEPLRSRQLAGDRTYLAGSHRLLRSTRRGNRRQRHGVRRCAECRGEGLRARARG